MIRATWLPRKSYNKTITQFPKGVALNRVGLGISLSIAGAGLLAFSLLLVLIKLPVHLAWHYAGAIILAGLLMLLIGFILRKT